MDWGTVVMMNYLKRLTQFFSLFVAGPFAVGFIAAWTAGLGLLLFVIGLPLLLAALVVAGLLFMVRGVKLAQQATATRERVIAALATPAMMLCALALAWPALGAGSYLGTSSRLIINRGHYEAIIAKAKMGQRSPSNTTAFEEDAGVEYIVDDGPPVRVAFNPAGLLDNWDGIIFDPTGDVTLANGFDPVTGKFAAPDRVTKLFGGDLVACRHLWGDYYDCSFT